MSDLPYLSIVASSRNDDHGGNTLYRTQIFIDSFLQQCERHRLKTELILVEWNPPRDRAGLAEVIDWQHQNSWVDCRIITVPYERHIFLRFARVLPLFQMIAKNVGIRRARGDFILATNIDILFSDELMAILAKKVLRADRQYRCDRFDVDSRIQIDISLDERLRYAKENIIRRNYRIHPPEIAALQSQEAPLEDIINAALKTGQFEMETKAGASVLTIDSNAPALWLHTNGCGDFTLLHRDGWEKIRGYAEFEIFSLHLDSLGIATAHHSGIRETWFPPPAVCYHIEHALGSGLTQENQTPLFERIEQQGISWFDYELIKPLLNEKQPFQFNSEKWGLRDIPLDETLCTREGFSIQKVPSSLQADPYAPVTAVHPELNTDLYFRRAVKHLTDQLHSFSGREDQIRSQIQINTAEVQLLKENLIDHLHSSSGREDQIFRRAVKHLTDQLHSFSGREDQIRSQIQINTAEVQLLKENLIDHLHSSSGREDQIRLQIQANTTEIQLLQETLKSVQKQWLFRFQQFTQQIIGRLIRWLGKNIRGLSRIRKVLQDRIAL